MQRTVLRRAPNIVVMVLRVGLTAPPCGALHELCSAFAMDGYRKVTFAIVAPWWQPERVETSSATQTSLGDDGSRSAPE